MTVVTQQNAIFQASALDGPPGLVGTIGVQAINAVTSAVVIPRTTAGISEYPVNSGTYFVVGLVAPATAGTYQLVWDTGLGDPVFATEPLVVQIAPLDGPVTGPCSLWVTPEEILATIPDVADPPTELELAPFAIMASEVLYEMTARQFTGSCEVTVRPCRGGCGCWGDDWGILNNAWFWGYGSLGWGYGWGWWGSDGSSCGCGCDDRVELSGYPVSSIVNVTVGADTIDPDGYQLQQERYLQRLWDTSTDPATPQFWPGCQNLNLPLGEPGTWSITYQFGTPPPTIGAQAATELAWQFWLAQHNPGECMLPTGVTRVQRQGVTIERLLPMFGKSENGSPGRTGLVLTDSFLGAYNPNGLRRRASVWSPDIQMPRRVP